MTGYRINDDLNHISSCVTH